MTIQLKTPHQVRRYFPAHFLPDLVLLVICMLLLLRLFAWIDPTELRDGSVFPWDAGVYKGVAEALQHWTPANPIIAEYPWGPRILFSLLYGGLARIFGVGDFQAAYLIEVGAILSVAIATFFFWRRNGLGRLLTWVGIVMFALSWSGPLRYAGSFPGVGFAFQQLTVWMTFAALILVGKGGVWRLASAAVLVFLASLSREFTTYILIFTVVVAVATRLLISRGHSTRRMPFVGSVTRTLAARKLPPLVLLTLVSIGGYILARFIVQDPASTYSIAGTAASYGYFHLNIMESLYPYIYAFGPFALAFALAMSFKKSRSLLSERLLERTANLDLVIVLMVVSSMFAFFGGTDSDRFLLWMFPFFGLIGLSSIAVLLAIGGRRASYAVVAVLAIGMLWTRFYVPSIPHLFFPGDNYCAQGGVRTNYDPSLYSGPPLLQSQRLPLITVDVDPDNEGLSTVYSSQATALIPVGCVPEWTTAIPNAYKHDINNLPVPFGFAHNQYELLVAHPYFGDWRVRAAILTQWGIAYLGLLAVLWRPLHTKRRIESAATGLQEG